MSYAAAGAVDAARRGEPGAKARADLLTPLAKAWGTDVGCEVASLAVQVHGGMGFIEETGVAQHYRDIRIAPIYEGTNGIQAADLVGRKISAEGGGAVSAWLDATRGAAHGDEGLLALLAAVEGAIKTLGGSSRAGRLGGSYPLLEMMAVATAGALLAHQARVAAERESAGGADASFLKAKQAVARYFMAVIVPEALGKAAAATLAPEVLYALSADELAA